MNSNGIVYSHNSKNLELEVIQLTYQFYPPSSYVVKVILQPGNIERRSTFLAKNSSDAIKIGIGMAREEINSMLSTITNAKTQLEECY